MDYFPLFARLTDVPCLLVGGGEVALRKLRLLLRAGARVTVLAPEIHAGIQQLAAENPALRLRQAEYEPMQISAFQFVIAATCDAALNQAVAADAAAAQRFCNVVDDVAHSSAIVPAIVDRSPLVIAVSTGGASPVLATQVRQQIEQLLPTGMAELARLSGAWRGVVKASLDDPGQRRKMWQQLLEGPLTEHVLNGDLQEAESALQTAIDAHREGTAASAQSGCAWLVGAGPGDPELLTLKAARVLRSADVVVHDRLVSPGVLEMARRDAEFITVGKQAGKASIAQDDINALLVDLVQAGKQVCRLKGGDPFIFGRGGEEIEALEAAGLRWQVVPGITAASGAAAALGLPLTHRNVARSLTLVTGHGADDYEPNWQMLSQSGQTVVFYMAVSRLEQICARMRAAGRSGDCPAVAVENASTTDQRLIKGTLASLPQLAADAGLGSPALLIIGESAALAVDRPEAGGQRNSGGMWSQPATVR